MGIRAFLFCLVLLTLVGACAPVASREPVASATATASVSPVVTSSPSPVPTASPTATPAPTPAATATRSPCQRDPQCNAVQQTIALIDPLKMNDHLAALTNVGSRDPRHPGHAKAAAYIKEQLGAHGLKIETQRTVYQGIPLENIFVTFAPKGSTAIAGKAVLISAHYDSTANRTPGWRPAIDPAPGADDNGTGTAALLEFARVLSTASGLKQSVTLAFFDGEELFFKGSAAYVASLPKPYPYQAAINLDMVGFNPLADRLDLLWYTNASAGLRDRTIKANATYAIGVSPLNAQFAADGNTIMDAAPFGLAGIPSIAICQRYGENDATFPGNYTFHTVNDTPSNVTNRRLWLKAAKLTLAVALELAS